MANLKDLSPDHPGHALGAGEVASLDGLRAVSVFIVMVAHSGLGWIVPGGFGVTLFFFISGFIITTLLIREQARHGTINIGAFYLRRALRLYPALLAFIILIIVAYAVTTGIPGKTGIAGGLLYFMNYLVIFSPQNVLPQSNHLWSLAVEAHFYLFYPLLFLWLGRDWRKFSVALALVCVASLAIRVWATWSFGDPGLIYEYAYQASEARLDSIAYGALCAVLLLSPIGDRVARVLTASNVVAIGLLVLAATLLFRNAMFRDTARYSLQGLALMPVITAAVLGGAWWIEKARTVLNAPAMVLGGALSYSLYLWHPALFALGPKLAGAEGAGIVLGWILTVIAAAVSYYGIERPLLSVRSRFGSGRSAVHAQAAETPAPAAIEIPTLREPRPPNLYVVSPPASAPIRDEPRTEPRRRVFFSSSRRNIP